jgi:hypothetical protein
MNKFKKIQCNCHKATFLIEKRSMKKLTLFEQLELRIHLAGCSVCRMYQKQSILIGQMVRQVLHVGTQPYSLNEQDKQIMEERIKDELKK